MVLYYLTRFHSYGYELIGTKGHCIETYLNSYLYICNAVNSKLRVHKNITAIGSMRKSYNLNIAELLAGYKQVKNKVNFASVQKTAFRLRFTSTDSSHRKQTMTTKGLNRRQFW